MKFGIVVFPGSNCDRDCFHVVTRVLGQDCVYIWHKEKNVPDIDCLILPGGFSYGDYLRAGAIARFSPVMDSVVSFAENGGMILGICNGFQILLEVGLLPGAMRRNSCGNFLCREVYLACINRHTPWTKKIPGHKFLRMPIAHAEGNYYAGQEEIENLHRNGQVLLKYSDSMGNTAPEANPNGSIDNIAGIMNRRGNIFGMMPHPERASEEILGSADGLTIFRSIAG
jgi:phosphoribosylformylglycinamidine synthase